MINLLKTPTAYRMLTSMIGPVLPFVARRRAKAGKEDPARLSERFGRSDHVRPSGELIWIHGASVGETQMIRPVIDQLLQKPDRHILVTSGTRTSADLLSSQLPERAIHQYVPFDTARATANFVSKWHPDLAIFVESELWPNLIWATNRADIPMALINARMSDKSIEGWKRRQPLARSVLSSFKTILAADRRTADGLAQISGRPVSDIGSLKLDAPSLEFDEAERGWLRAAIGKRPVWLAASTHEAEEAIFHDMFRALQGEAYMIWLPRHPSRGSAIATALGTTPRSQDGLPEGDVYVMDTMGEMGLALALADVCVIGGSYEPSLMGHNPLEAARAGVPAITGPYHASFVDLFRKMVEHDAVRLSDAGKTPDLIRLAFSGGFDDMRDNAMGFAAQTSGTLDRTIHEIEALL